MGRKPGIKPVVKPKKAKLTQKEVLEQLIKLKKEPHAIPGPIPGSVKPAGGQHHAALGVPGIRHMAIEHGLISTREANTIANRNRQKLHLGEGPKVDPLPDTGKFNAMDPETWVHNEVTQTETVAIPVDSEPAFSAAADMLALASQVVPENKEADALYTVESIGKIETEDGRKFNGALAVTTAAVEPTDPTVAAASPTINVVPIDFEGTSQLRATEVNGDIMKAVAGQVVADDARSADTGLTPEENSAYLQGQFLQLFQQPNPFFGSSQYPLKAKDKLERYRYASVPHPGRLLHVIQSGQDQVDTPDYNIRINPNHYKIGSVTKHINNSQMLGTKQMIGTRAALHAAGTAHHVTTGKLGLGNVGLSIFGGIGKAIGGIVDGGDGPLSAILGTVGTVIDTIIPIF